MRLLDLLLRLYAYIELHDRDQKTKDSMIEETREFLRLYEDGLRWCEIKKHLTVGCDCEEASEAEKDKLLKILRRRNPKIDSLTKDCRKERVL